MGSETCLQKQHSSRFPSRRAEKNVAERRRFIGFSSRHSRLPHRNLKIITHKEAKVHESGKNYPIDGMILSSCIWTNPPSPGQRSPSVSSHTQFSSQNHRHYKSGWQGKTHPGEEIGNDILENHQCRYENTLPNHPRFSLGLPGDCSFID